MFYLDKKTLHISHTDMDGSGCLIISKKAGLDRDCERISYTKIQETLKNLLANTKKYKQLLVTDLMFQKEDFELLVELSEKLDQILFIDHHSYETFNPKDYENKKLKIIINRNACATKLTYAYFKDQGDVKDYREFIEIVNAYDIYVKDSKYFKISKHYNRLFWDMRATAFEFYFTKNIELDDMMKNKIKRIDKEIKDFFEQNKKQIISNDNIVFSFLDKHIGELYDFYPTQKVLINLRNDYHFSVRINNDLVPEEQAKKIKTILCEKIFEPGKLHSAGGHTYAFGITLIYELEDFEKQQVCEKITKIVEKVLDV